LLQNASSTKASTGRARARGTATVKKARKGRVPGVKQPEQQAKLNARVRRSGTHQQRKSQRKMITMT
jgi:hypothetical protein